MDGMQWPIASGAVRPVMWRVLLAGTPLAGCESVEIHSTSHRKASTVHATFALTADPAAVNTWADMDPPILLEVQAALVGDYGMAVTWQSVFTGEANDIHIDMSSMKVDVSGRDLAGRLIDGKTVETFRNNTGSEIVQIVASRFGLTADVDATTIPAGAYYQLEHDKLTSGSFSKTTSYWDLLCFLASQDDRDLYVTGTTLHYKVPVDLLVGPAVPLVWTPAPTDGGSPHAALTDLTMHRTLVLAKGIKVVVRIWDSKGKNAKNIIYPPGAGKDAQEFVFTKSGWSAERALQFAQSNYADILRHQRALELAMPGEFSLSCRSAVALSGVPGESFNTKYLVDEITRTFDLTGGFKQSVSLKNHSNQSDAEVG